MTIRFLTERDIEQAASQGATEIILAPQTRVTDLAREAAQRLGLRFVTPDEAAAASSSATPSAAVSAPAPAAFSELHQQVRTAIVSQLGMTPDGLDEIIARVLQAVEDANR